MTQTINRPANPYKFNAATTTHTDISDYHATWLITEVESVNPDSVTVISETDFENLSFWKAETLEWAETFVVDLPEENAE